MSGMKPVKGSPNKAAAKTPSRGHSMRWVERLFDCIACFRAKHCDLAYRINQRGAVPRRVTALFIAKLEGLTQRQGLCCPVGWLSRVHPDVARGPITYRLVYRLAPKVIPRRVTSVFDSGPYHWYRTSQQFSQ